MHIQARNALVEKNLHLVAKAARRPNQFPMTYDERYSIGCEALMSAATTYKPDKGSLSTIFYARFSAKTIDAYRRNRNPKNMISMDAPLLRSNEDGDLTLHDVIPNLELDTLDVVIERETIRELGLALSRIPAMHRRVLMLRYVMNGGMAQEDVAKRLRKPQCWVSRREREALNLCRQEMVC